MKTIVVFLGIVAVSLAEKEAPYPPSGWKPDGPQLTYPPPTPSNEYGPATTPAPTEQPTQAPQEPPATYIPAEETSTPSNGYSRYQSQRLTQASQLNQPAGQFFIITPQGQLQHIPIVVPQATNKDAEAVDPQIDERASSSSRLVNQQRQKTSQRGQSASAKQPSITPDGRVGSQRQETSARLTSKAPAQGQFVAFIPAVPLSRVQESAMVQQANQQNGQYHVIYPNGKLQRVQYMNMLGPNNRLTANVQYQEVDPIRGPLYTFGAPLVRVF